MRKAKQYLNKLLKIQPEIRVQSFLDYPKPWTLYNPNGEEFKSYVKEYGFPNHREILRNEVVIDVDPEVKEDGKIHADMVESKLKKLNLDYKRYQSGGSGEHFHLIFDTIPAIVADEYYISRIKYKLIEFLLGKFLLSPNGLNSHVCMANKTLIQIEYAKHRKGGTKTLISGNLRDNPVPFEFYDFLAEWVGKRKAIQKLYESVDEPDNLNCIQFIEGKVINGNNYFAERRLNYRALFALTAYYTKKFKNKIEVLREIQDWYENVPELMKKNEPAIHKNLIAYTVRTSNGSAGCMYRMDLMEQLECESVCDGCPFNGVITEK